MRLDPDSLLFGVAPAILKDCAAQLREFAHFSQDDFCKAIGAPADEALPVLEQMIIAGFVAEHETMPGNYAGTGKLPQLAVARITKGIPRSAAEILLQKVIERAKIINANPDGYGNNRITRLAVFGSYLGDADVLGDIDIAFEYARAPSEDNQEQRQYFNLEASLAKIKKIISFLRLRNPKRISLHEWDELMGLKTPFRIVFEDCSST